ncbi:sensor histidine kinase [Clostridium muellerianum]|uniref:sensor histidine kinase n=1 Tax=Clostridium muellerianum TaxID=2716538 RepID=UPI001FADCC2C|nr:HAMP domain-containing sensor histidine kinase [Clostridium muellerianum]
MKDEFFTIISHELRTPLTIICSSLQLAYDVYSEEITPNMDKTLSRIDQNCSRLLKLINNILDISKAEAGFLTLNNSDFDIVYVSETILNSSNSYAVSKDIELVFDTDEEEINVTLDKDKYEKILLNLLSNAIKFTPGGRKIIVSLRSEKEYFYLSVKDFGIGIDNDKISCIFDRFSQINTSLSRRAEGTGIGLALVKKIIELMEGTIKVISEVGEGTEFIVKLRKVNEKENHINNYAILTDNINDRINIEFSDIN